MCPLRTEPSRPGTGEALEKRRAVATKASVGVDAPIESIAKKTPIKDGKKNHRMRSLIAPA